ncbi:MAG: 4Fe-4S dicluster domain-containing protein [bacterium]|nr:4Fe-4S dicluster domain-containing protein [bacterium]
MIEQLRQTCRRLLEDGRVQVVIGYGQSVPGRPAIPVFIRRPEDADLLVWNDRCFTNLTAYLKRPEVRALGRPAVVVKGCDERAVVVLEKESQLIPEDVHMIGMVCAGMDDPPAAKCAACDAHVPRHADEVIGEAPNPAPEPPGPAQRYAELAAFMELPQAERMAYWMGELARCVKCYACRQVCPLCYCERCIVAKNRPTVIDTSATLAGNFAWAITRAFHLAGRCAGCDECTRACPAGIDLRLLNQSLARVAEESFGYRAGTDPQAEPVIGAYALLDQESFIR